MASLARHDHMAGAPRAAGPRPAFVPDRSGFPAFQLLQAAGHDRSLSSLIESEIIPRLLVAHGAETPAVAPASTEQGIDPADVAELAPLALEVEADALLTHVEAILARGVGVEAVMVDLLAPTARLLGEFWEQDRCDFVDVTMGLWRLQEVVHEIAARRSADRAPPGGGRRALFASMPGDQHNFGTVVIDEMFRRDGWTTDRMGDAALPDLLRRVGADWFDLVGLTISCDCHAETLPSLIVALRTVSHNPHVCVMVGGRICVADPELAARVGADGTASDAKLALQVAADLVRARAEAPSA